MCVCQIQPHSYVLDTPAKLHIKTCHIGSGSEAVRCNCQTTRGKETGSWLMVAEEQWSIGEAIHGRQASSLWSNKLFFIGFGLFRFLTTFSRLSHTKATAAVWDPAKLVQWLETNCACCYCRASVTAALITFQSDQMRFNKCMAQSLNECQAACWIKVRGNGKPNSKALITWIYWIAAKCAKSVSRQT